VHALTLLFFCLLTSPSVLARGDIAGRQVRLSSTDPDCSTQGSITVSSPAADQTLAVNQTVSIEWTYQNTQSNIFDIAIGDPDDANFAIFASTYSSRAVSVSTELQDQNLD